MKKPLLAIAVLFSLGVAAQAQIYNPQNTLIQNIGIAASTGTNFVTPVVINCKKQKDVTLQITSSNTLATGQAASIKFFLVSSIDGSSYSTAGNVYNCATPNGTTAVTTVTNIPTWGAGYLKVLWVTNGAEGSTNVGALSMGFAEKIGAP